MDDSVKNDQLSHNSFMATENISYECRLREIAVLMRDVGWKN